MNDNKKDILKEQIAKLDEVLSVLKENFDIENEIPDEYSFLSIVKSNLAEMVK